MPINWLDYTDMHIILSEGAKFLFSKVWNKNIGMDTPELSFMFNIFYEIIIVFI